MRRVAFRKNAFHVTALQLTAGLILAAGLLAPRPASADRYDPERAGHPLRIAAYILHPIGVGLDYLLMRPAHWFVSHEPFQTIFGHED
jgi:hypothetical protein